MSLRAKTGDTLSLRVERTDSDGQPVDLTGAAVTAQMRRRGEAVDLAVAMVEPAAGICELSLPAAATAMLTPGLWDLDVQFVLDGFTASSETFPVVMEQDVTRAG